MQFLSNYIMIFMYILFDWFESCSEVDIDFMSPVLVCAEQGFSCKTNSGIWLAFSSDRMTSKKMREISAISGAKENDTKISWVFFAWIYTDRIWTRRKKSTNWSMWWVSWFSVVLYHPKHFWNVIPILLLADQPTISAQTSAVDDLEFAPQAARYFHSERFAL